MQVWRAGAIAVAIIAVFTFFSFTRINPFSNHFELKAQFQNSMNLKRSKSEVRIAGVEVGRVKRVESISEDSSGALVTMEIQKSGLPIHSDAELKIRPNIFLEGNYFVDLKPGSPSAPTIDDGHTVPITQTAIPVQFGDLLTALQSDTRRDLRTALREYALVGLNGGGADGFNDSIQYWEAAYRSASLVNDAMLGTRPGDLRKVLSGQQRTLAALSDNEDALQGTITNLNMTANALAREDDALEAAIPALRDVLVAGPPALRSLNASLPSVSRFARDALPGVRSSRPTLDALIPFVAQLRALVQPSELRGLVADLRPTVPALARLNRRTVPILGESRAMAACANNVLIPWQESPIPNPDEPGGGNNNELVMRQLPRSLVGLAGESRMNDANTPYFRVNFSGGNQGVFFGNSSDGPAFSGFQSTAAAPGSAGVRPALPERRGMTDENDARPDFRPDIPCETQEPPNLEAPRGGVTPTGADGPPNISTDDLLVLLDTFGGSEDAEEPGKRPKAQGQPDEGADEPAARRDRAPAPRPQGQRPPAPPRAQGERPPAPPKEDAG